MRNLSACVLVSLVALGSFLMCLHVDSVPTVPTIGANGGNPVIAQPYATATEVDAAGSGQRDGGGTQVERSAALRHEVRLDGAAVVEILILSESGASITEGRLVSQGRHKDGGFRDRFSPRGTISIPADASGDWPVLAQARDHEDWYGDVASLRSAGFLRMKRSRVVTVVLDADVFLSESIIIRAQVAGLAKKGVPSGLDAEAGRSAWIRHRWSDVIHVRLTGDHCKTCLVFPQSYSVFAVTGGVAVGPRTVELHGDCRIRLEATPGIAFVPSEPSSGLGSLVGGGDWDDRIVDAESVQVGMPIGVEWRLLLGEAELARGHCAGTSLGLESIVPWPGGLRPSSIELGFSSIGAEVRRVRREIPYDGQYVDLGRINVR
jgi:hypothetical protein